MDPPLEKCEGWLAAALAAATAAAVAATAATEAATVAATQAATTQAATAAAAVAAVLQRLEMLECAMRHRDAEAIARSTALADSIDRVLADQRAAQRDADLAQAHAEHNATLQLDKAAAEATRASLDAKLHAECERSRAREVQAAELQRDLDRERDAHQALRAHLAVPVHRGHAFEDASVEWMRGLGLEVVVTRDTPHRANALVTLPGSGIKVLVDFKNVLTRQQASDHMRTLVNDAEGYAQRGAEVGGVVILYPDAMGGDVTDCVQKLTKGSTGLDSVGGIRANRKIFCTRRLFLHALFRVADSHSGGTTGLFDYQDQTCVRMVTLASRVASMPLLPLLVACEALCSVKPAFKHLQNVHKEWNILPPAPSIESQPPAPASAGALSVEPLGWGELGGPWLKP